MSERTKKSVLANVLIGAVAVAVVALIVLAIVRKNTNEAVMTRKNLMGTLVEFTFMGGDASRYDAASEAAFAEISRLEGLMSSYKPDSDVSRMNAHAGEMVDVSPDTIEVLEASRKISELSDGAFDPAIGALGIIWGNSGEKGNVPGKEDIAKLLPLVDYRAVMIDRAGGKAGLKTKGMSINLGGIAKGYIVAKAAEVLKKNGVERAIVKAGGDMRVFQKAGEPAGAAKPFNIGVQDPRNNTKLSAELHVNNGAVSTSGDYERFFEKDGKRYHHILDPRTGFPADKSESVTVVADDSTEADGLSTAIFVMGWSKGIALAEKLGVQCLIVDSEGNIHVTKKFEGKLLE